MSDETDERNESAPWLELLEQAEAKFRSYYERAENIDKLFADLERQASNVRDPEFALFWANIEVIKPTVYSREPVPAVSPNFNDRDPVLRVTSELLERSAQTGFKIAGINEVMKHVRDDLLVAARGQAWVRYETKAEAERYGGWAERNCIDFLHRRDFLHDPARTWEEVEWVANGNCWLTREKMKERFEKHSGEAWTQADYKVRRGPNGRESWSPNDKCQVWELWHKTKRKVVWVARGAPTVLDEGEPHLDLEGFFPCPRPAYTTTGYGSLIPVPDFVYYKDQLDEINKLTARIHALSDALQVKGFYPAGGEIGDAIETALNIYDNRQIMVPVSSLAAFGSGGSTIVWLPLDMIAETIRGLFEMRRSVIDDVYQITGISDILRGESDANETLGAQQIKVQTGAVRIRDKQAELVRFARDLTRIMAEIMAEHFDQKTLMDMAQMQIPTDADLRKEVKPLEDQAEAIKAEVEAIGNGPAEDPEAVEQAQQLVQQAQQHLAQLGEQAMKIMSRPTIEAVMKVLRDQRIRPFALDIETDSTIQVDEAQEKASRAEFVDVMGRMMQQFLPVVQAEPAAAMLVGEILKFALAPYRAGRQLETTVEEFVEQIQARASQPQADPGAQAAQAAAEAEQAKAQGEMQLKQAELQMRQQEAQATLQAQQAEAQLRAQEAQTKAEMAAQEMQAKVALEAQQAQAEAALKEREAQVQAEVRAAELAMKREEMAAKAVRDAEAHQQDMQKRAAEIRKIEAETARVQEQIAAQAQSVAQSAAPPAT